MLGQTAGFGQKQTFATWARAGMSGLKNSHYGPKNMDLADHIFSKQVVSADPKLIADIYARLIWLTEDNGHEIAASLRRWLTEDDPLKAQIALLVGEVWLWETLEEMENVLAVVETRFPTLSELCSTQRFRWNNQQSENLRR